MSEHLEPLVAAYVAQRQRAFHQSTRGIPTPENRAAWELDASEKIRAHDREVKAEVLREVADKVNAGRNSHWLIEAADSWAGYYSGVRAGMEAGESALRDTADRIESEARP